MSTHNLARTTSEYIADTNQHARAIIDALRMIILDAEPHLEEAIKWHRLTFTMHGDWHHWICGIAPTKNYVSLIFHKGALLHDPARVLQGSGQYTRQIQLTHVTEIDRRTLTELIREAVAKQTAM